LGVDLPYTSIIAQIREKSIVKIYKSFGAKIVEIGNYAEKPAWNACGGPVNYTTLLKICQ
jgi:hypothetical protein